MIGKNTNLGTIEGNKNVHIGDRIIYLSSLFHAYKKQLEDIKNLIFSFKPKTALELLNNLEPRISEVEDNKEKDKIKSNLIYLKALCKKELLEFSKEETAKDFIQAYNLNPNDDNIKENVCVEYLNLNEIEKSKNLADEILKKNEYSIAAWYVLSVINNNLQDFLNNLPKTVLENEHFQYSIMYHIMRKSELNGFKEMENYGFSLDINIENFKEVNYKNKTAWVVILDLLVNKFFYENPIRYISGDNFIFEINLEIKNITTLLKIYISSLKDTEIIDTTYHQQFCLFYFNYLTENKDEDFDKLIDTFLKLENNYWFYINGVCQIYNHKKEFEKSLQALNNYEKNNGELHSEFFLFKSVVLHFLNKNEEIENLLCMYIDSIDIIDEIHIWNIINAFFNIQYQFSDKQLFEKELNKIKEKPFLYDELKELFEIATLIKYIKEFDTKVCLNTLNRIKHCNKFSIYSNNLIANLLEILDSKQSAINFMNTYLDKSKPNESLRNYILILYSQLIDDNKNERGNYKELLELLKLWRQNYDGIDVELLGIEHNLYTEVNDLVNLEIIDELLYNSYPENEQYIMFYLALLERKKKVEKLNEISNNIPSNFENEVFGVNVSGILLRNKINSKKGAEILYNLAKEPNNTTARKNFVGGSTMFQDFFEKYNKVEIGHWVVYSINDEVKKEKIVEKKEFHKKLIDKKVGDKISVTSKITGKINTLEIIEIYNDALSLFRDIMEEARNPTNELGFEMFYAPKNIEDFEKMMIEHFGAKGSQDKIYIDKLLNDYYNRKIGFTEVTKVFKGNYIDTYLYLTNYKGSKFITLPNKATRNITSKNENVTFSIDFSTLLLFYFLEKELKFKFVHKFLISFYIKKEIEDEITEINNSPEHEISVQITLEGITKYNTPKNQKENKANFLNKLLEWINKNCEVDTVEEKLETIPKINREFDNNDLMNMVFDLMHLSTRENERLISNETALFVYNNHRIFNNFLNPEKYLRTFYPEQINNEFYRFLLKSNYLGIDINLDTMKNEFFDFIAGKENYYLNVISNLNYSIHGNSSIIYVVSKFLKEMYLIQSLSLDNKNRFALEVFKSALYRMPTRIINLLEQLVIKEFKLLGDYYDEVLIQFHLVKNIFNPRNLN